MNSPIHIWAFRHATLFLLVACGSLSSCQSTPTVGNNDDVVPPQSAGGDACLSDADCAETFPTLPACRVARCNPSTGACFIDDALDGIPCVAESTAECNATCQQGECTGTPCSEHCTNGIDDDANGDVDCADPGCTSAPECAEAACAAGFPVSCGASITSSTLGAQSTSSIDDNPCNSWDLSGPEQVFRVPAGPAMSVSATLDVKSEDLRLVVHEVTDESLGCAQEICVTAGEDTVQWNTTAGTEYLIRVDGHQGAAGVFALQFNCHASTEVLCNNGIDEDADDLIDCEDPECEDTPICTGCIPFAPLGCGSTLGANTSSPLATQNLAEYPCHSETLAGPEMAYLIEASDTPITYTALMASQTGGHLLSRIVPESPASCVADDCVESGNSLMWTSVPGQPSVLIIDSSVESAGEFALQLLCEAGTEFDCANGVDEDGNGLIDCEDPACGAPEGCGLCQPLWPLTCNSAFEFSTSSPLATHATLVAGCENQDPTPGAEVAFSFQTPTAQYVTAQVTTNDPGSRVTWIVAGPDGECNPEACVSEGAQEAALLAMPNQLYHVLVDSTVPGTMDFQLSILCGADMEMECANGVDEDNDGFLDCLDSDCDGSPDCADCLPIQTLNCDTTHGSPLAAEFYTEAFSVFPCGDTPSKGLEATWRLAPPLGTTMSIVLANAPEDSHLHLVGEDPLNGCDATLCVDSAPSQIAFTPTLELPTAMLVVDLPEGDLSPFLIGATCGPALESLCDNGEDEDNDGFVDCADPDCSDDPACPLPLEIQCHDGVDNDMDGKSDCADSDCIDSPPCGTCVSTQKLLCDAPIMGMTNGSSSASNIDANPCALDTPAPGSETTIRIGSVLTGPTPLQITADPGTLVTLLEMPGGGCHMSQCIAAGEANEVNWVLEPTNGTYYLVFDSSPEGTAGMFDASLDCP